MKSESSTAVKEDPEKRKKKNSSSAAAVKGETEPNWAASGISSALRDAGLLECSDEKLQKRMLNHEDDEVSCEIRDLQLLVRDHVRRSNEKKRVLRNFLQGYVTTLCSAIVSHTSSSLTNSLCILFIPAPGRGWRSSSKKTRTRQ